MPLTSEDIDAICGFVIDLCGVYLDEKKEYLIEARLSSLLGKYECENYVDLVKRARLHSDTKLKTDIVNAITTNETLFFRDNSPFEALKHKTIPELIDARSTTPFPQRIRIWSAACSTGQEPYSIAMTLCDLIPNIDEWDVKILATDVSNEAIAKASRGLYSDYEVERGLPIGLLRKYFKREDGGWKIEDRIRGMIHFKQLNLFESWAGVTKQDVIFCRNVAIYFSPSARKQLFENLSDMLAEDGYLFVGSSEILSDLGKRFQPQYHCRAAFYRPNIETMVEVKTSS